MGREPTFFNQRRLQLAMDRDGIDLVILRGNDNLTLKSIVAVAIGLDCRVELQLRHAPSDRPQGAPKPVAKGARALASSA